MPQKLSARYYGPYTIIEKIRKVANMVQLPPSARIHNVFHVSQLKKYEGSSAMMHSDPPLILGADTCGARGYFGEENG